MNINNAPSETGGQTVEVIGFGRRLVAYLLDLVILMVLGFCMGFVIGFVGATGGEDAASGVWTQCLGVLISCAYYVVFWATSGQTPGKMALGIKVISTDGSPVGWGQAILRYIGYLISGLVLSLGFIWAAFDAKRQGWHDKMANTYVVRKETSFSSRDAITVVPSDSDSSSVLIILLVLIPIMLVLVTIVVIAILLLLGPVIGNVFSNIVMNLEATPPQ